MGEGGHDWVRLGTIRHDESCRYKTVGGVGLSFLANGFIVLRGGQTCAAIGLSSFALIKIFG